MTIISPAIWSGNCPKTLLLRGGAANQGISTQPPNLHVPTPTGKGPLTSGYAVETVDDTVTNTTIDLDVGTTAVSLATQAEEGPTSISSHHGTEVVLRKVTSQTADANSKDIDPSATSTVLQQEIVDSITKVAEKEDLASEPSKATGSPSSKTTDQIADTTQASQEIVDSTTEATEKEDSTTESAKAAGTLSSGAASPAIGSTNTYSDHLATSTEENSTITVNESAPGKTSYHTTAPEETTYITNSESISDPVTETTSPYVDPTTRKATENISPTPSSHNCWPVVTAEESDSVSAEQSWAAAIKVFCHQFVKTPLAPNDRSRVINQDNLTFGAHIMPSCTKSELDEVECLEYMEKIEEQCHVVGGFIQEGCFFLWIAWRSVN
ncbi:unnamed protein product [Fusarium langsethiae]|nr:unnamed protein product [Fusarium langsethiae]